MSRAFSIQTWPMVCLAAEATPSAWRADLHWSVWPHLEQNQVHRAQEIQYHLHSSQRLRPAGSQSDHSARRATSDLPHPTETPTAPGSHLGLWGCVRRVGGHCSLHQLLPEANDTDLVSLCGVLLALRIWHHRYFLNGTMKSMKSHEVWVSLLLFDK